MLSSPLVNDRLGRLSDYPFTRLATLLSGITPRANVEPVIMSVGEPQHAPPVLIDEVLRTRSHLWGKYPPVAGTPEFRASAARWLKRRYMPSRWLDRRRKDDPAGGGHAGSAVPGGPAGGARVQGGPASGGLLPNPFYAAYEGAAVMAGAEAVFLTTTRETGLPARSRRAVARPAGAYGSLLSLYAVQSAGRRRRPGLSGTRHPARPPPWLRAGGR